MAVATPAMKRTSTPGIFKRGGRYVVVFRDPNGRQKKAFARTLAEARDVKASLRADITRGEYRTLSRVTFAEYAPTWIGTYAGRTSRGVNDVTRSDYWRSLERHALPFFGRKRLAEIEPQDVKAFAAAVVATGVKRNTVRLAMAPVRALLATALEDGLIRSNPAAGLRLFLSNGAAEHGTDPETEQVKALTEAELGRLLTELPDESRPFFAFLAQTGLRIGEAIELRWRDIDLGGRWIHVRRRVYRGGVDLPKGRKGRRIPLSEALARDLWAHRKETRAGDDELVFVSEKGMRVDQSNLASRVLKPALRRADVGAWVGFHTFRHTCATLLFRNGWNAAQVQKFLGHTDPGFTLRTYVHLLPEDLPEPPFLDIFLTESGHQIATMGEMKGTVSAVS